jgi:thiosulfate/3-mercaptopyruvate sulfurtransferase
MRKSLLAVLLVLTGVVGAQAATPRDALVVNTSWLAGHLTDKDLVILHVGSEAGYKAGHIPGARLVDGKILQVNTPEGLSVEVPPPDVLHQQLEALGISDNSRVIVYNEADEFQRATRVLFTLDVAGLGDHTSLLDGGLAEWKKTGHAASTDAPQIAQGHLAPLSVQPRVVDAKFVQSHMKTPGYDLIDARAAVFYGGLVAKMTGDGHIPGAKSLPYTSVYDSDGKLKSPEELKSLFAATGVKPGDHVVAYCQVGGQSSAVVFAARTVGIQPQLYDGSFQDWSKRGLPVETSTAPGAAPDK